MHECSPGEKLASAAFKHHNNPTGLIHFQRVSMMYQFMCASWRQMPPFIDMRSLKGSSWRVLMCSLVRVQPPYCGISGCRPSRTCRGPSFGRYFDFTLWWYNIVHTTIDEAQNKKLCLGPFVFWPCPNSFFKWYFWVFTTFNSFYFIPLNYWNVEQREKTPLTIIQKIKWCTI